jgi:hypothetical protein
MVRRTTVHVVFDRQYPAAVLTIAAPKVRRGAEMIADIQRRTIPVSADGSYGRPAGYARDNIDVWAGVDTVGPYLDVGTDATTPDGTSYPAILDAGSRPHLIESHGDYPLRNRRTGQVFGRTVLHPGTKPTYWCRRSILAIAGRTL